MNKLLGVELYQTPDICHLVWKKPFQCLWLNFPPHLYFFLFFYAGILEVLHCVLVESPEALNIIKEGHIKSIISLLDKHGRNHKVPYPNEQRKHIKILQFLRKIGVNSKMRFKSPAERVCKSSKLCREARGTPLWFRLMKVWWLEMWSWMTSPCCNQSFLVASYQWA